MSKKESKRVERRRSVSDEAPITLADLSLNNKQRGVLLNAAHLSSMDDIRDKLRPYYAMLVQLYEHELLEQVPDYRSGMDTYGYEDLSSVQGSLTYISDRWKSSFRVRWLIELINPDYVLYSESKSV